MKTYINYKRFFAYSEKCNKYFYTEFGDSINIIYGKNGIGKTNILEAISFLSPGKGFLNANLNEVLRISNDKLQNNNWTIFANINDNNIADSLSVFSSNENGVLKKKVKINGNLVRSQEGLNEIFNVIWLAPNMQNLFNDDKSVRRKFLDRTVYLIDNQHASRVAKYEFLIKERMKVLTDDCKFDKNWLNILEQKIAETGISIAVARNNTVRYLNKILMNYDFNFPKFIITIDGKIENMMLENIKSVQAENKFKKILLENREQDKELKRTSEGVHKSDLRVFYSNKNVDAEYCSTGEQKLFLISFTILKALLCKELNKATPIILLDEVFSYLDKSKKTELFNELLKLKIQIFITGTDIKIFDDVLKDQDKINIINLKEFI